MVPAWYHVGPALWVFDSKIIVYFWFFLIFTRAGLKMLARGVLKIIHVTPRPPRKTCHVSLVHKV